jgi:hypothetical protein
LNASNFRARSLVENTDFAGESLVKGCPSQNFCHLRGSLISVEHPQRVEGTRPDSVRLRLKQLPDSLRLIRFGGHLLKGGYDVHNGRNDPQRPVPPPPVSGSALPGRGMTGSNLFEEENK